MVDTIEWVVIATTAGVSLPGGPGEDDDAFRELLRVDYELDETGRNGLEEFASRGSFLMNDGLPVGYHVHCYGGSSMTSGLLDWLPVVAVEDPAATARKCTKAGGKATHVDSIRDWTRANYCEGTEIEYVLDFGMFQIGVCHKNSEVVAARGDLRSCMRHILVASDIESTKHFLGDVFGWVARKATEQGPGYELTAADKTVCNLCLGTHDAGWLIALPHRPPRHAPFPLVRNVLLDSEPSTVVFVSKMHDHRLLTDSSGPPDVEFETTVGQTKIRSVGAQYQTSSTGSDHDQPKRPWWRIW